jgi:hypothetical protein
MTKPILPDEIPEEKKKQLPPEIIEAFNFLIAQNYNSDSRCANVSQPDVIDEIHKRLQIERQEIFNRKYLDVEDIYRKEGWLVSYDKPVYYESYNAYFLFKTPSN